MTSAPLLRGSCAPGFEGVRAAFAENFEKHGEIGAAVAVVVDGKRVVDLWAGLADKTLARPWEQDTLVNVYSTTKGLTAICAHRLVDQGKLDLDAPVSRYWPEFAAAGKERITVRSLLGHRAGLPAIRAPLPAEALFDWDMMTGALAAETPWWEPDALHGYHAITFGWLVGEVVRRVSGKSIGTYFREEIATPLELDCHIGLAASEDPRCAALRHARSQPGDEPPLFQRIMSAPDSMTAKAFTNPITLVLPGTVASRAWRGAELPAVNGHATARSVARLYGALASGGAVDDVRVLTPSSVARCSEELSSGMDAVLGVPTRFGPGFMLSQPGAAFGPGPRPFGHPGAGGSVGFADPDARVGFGYVMNRMGREILLDPRAASLIAATYASL